MKSDDTAAFFGVRHITRRVPVLGVSSTADLAGHTGSYPLRAIPHQHRLACGQSGASIAPQGWRIELFAAGTPDVSLRLWI